MMFHTCFLTKNTHTIRYISRPHIPLTPTEIIWPFQKCQKIPREEKKCRCINSWNDVLRVHNLTLKLCICHFRNRKCDPKEQEKTLLLLDPFETSIHSAHGQTLKINLNLKLDFGLALQISHHMGWQNC